MTDGRRRLAVIGDVHGHTERLAATLDRLAPLGPFALVLQTGDVGRDPPWRHRAQRAEHDASVSFVLETLGARLSAPVAFVPGNHDLPEPAAGLPATNVDGVVAEVGGLRVAGLGGAGPTRFGFPYEWGEDEASGRLARVGELLGDEVADVLLIHAPPLETLDCTRSGSQVGSRAVAEATARLQPRLFVCGHIHEAEGVALLEGVPCLNAGALGEPFGQVLGWVVEWDDGPRRVLRVGVDGEPREAWRA